MKRFLKNKKYTLLVIGVVAVFMFSSIFSGSSISYPIEKDFESKNHPQSATLELPEDVPSEAVDWSYDQWLNFVLEYHNATLEEYTQGSEEEKYLVNNITQIMFDHCHGGYPSLDDALKAIDNLFHTHYAMGYTRWCYYDYGVEQPISKDDYIYDIRYNEKRFHFEFVVNKKPDSGLIKFPSYCTQVHVFLKQHKVHTNTVNLADGVFEDGSTLTKVNALEPQHPGSGWIRMDVMCRWHDGSYDNPQNWADHFHDTSPDRREMVLEAKKDNLHFLTDDAEILIQMVSIYKVFGSYTNYAVDEQYMTKTKDYDDPTERTSDYQYNNIEVVDEDITPPEFIRSNHQMGTRGHYVTRSETLYRRESRTGYDWLGRPYTYYVWVPYTRYWTEYVIDYHYYYGDRPMTFNSTFKDAQHVWLKGLIEYQKDSGEWRNAKDDNLVSFLYDSENNERDFIFNMPQGEGTHGLYQIRYTVWNSDNDHDVDDVTSVILSNDQVSSLSGDRESMVYTTPRIYKYIDRTEPSITITPSSDIENIVRTDGNPGDWHVDVWEDVSDLAYVEIKVDDVSKDPAPYVNQMEEDYAVPRELGFHTIQVYAENDDPDNPLDNEKMSTIEIIDDDTKKPDISITRKGDGTEATRNGWTVEAYDKSGLSEFKIFINDKKVGEENGTYYLDEVDGIGEIGDFLLRVYVTDNDKDRDYDTEQDYDDDILKVSDDDEIPPEIVIERVGDGTDNTRNGWKVNASDASDLSKFEIRINGTLVGEENGTYYINDWYGDILADFHITVDVIDEDNDGWEGDMLPNNDDDLWKITDDDITAPEINVIHIGNNLDGDPGSLELSIFEDNDEGIATGTLTITGPLGFSWIEDYEEGVATVNLKSIGVCELGTYSVTLYAENNDEDRGSIDEESDSKVISFTIDDDDEIAPEIVIERVGSETDATINGWKVNAFDASSLSLYEIRINGTLVGGENGTYYINDWYGDILADFNITVDVMDADDDRSGDVLPNYMFDSFTVTDDDITAPDVSVIHIGNNWDSDPGFLEFSIIEDDSGSEATGTLTITGPLGFTWSDNYGEGTATVNLDAEGFCVPGVYSVTLYAENNDEDRGLIDEESDAMTISFNIYDDDETAPELSLIHTGNSWDSDPGIIEFSAIENDVGSSATGTLTIIGPLGYFWTQTLEDISGPIDLMTLGINELGTYTATLYAENNDEDGWDGDEESDTMTIYMEITDDDTDAPEITITYDGWETDQYPGGWTVGVYDSSGFSEYNIYINDVMVGHENGTYFLPHDVGLFEINVTAIDGDDDRLDDCLRSTITETIDLVDDDTNPPLITNFEIHDEIYYLNISFDTSDYSGISQITVTIDGVFVETFNPIMGETEFDLWIFNDWAMELGIHDVIVEIWDADFDREGDSLSTIVTGTFAIEFEEMKEFVLWEIDQLIAAIQASPDELWTKDGESQKSTMISKLEAMRSTVLSEGFVGAYDKILHDIKPLLTGLKCDEDGDIFGAGVFNNAWFTADDFEALCDEILTNLQILIDESS